MIDFFKRNEVFAILCVQSVLMMKHKSKYHLWTQPTDAIEGGYAFNMNPDGYTFETTLSHEIGYSEDLEKAVELEEKTVKFYCAAAAQSKSLLADVPRNFALIAKRRANRISQLRSLIY